MRAILLSLVILLCAPVWSEEGFYKVAPGREMYAKTWRGDPTQAAVVLPNGLTQDTRHWATTLEEIRKSGRTVTVYDAILEGRSLERHIDQTAAWSKLGTHPI